MLSKEQNYILYLLRKSLGVQAESVEGQLDEELVKRYILKSGILLTVYSSLSEELKKQMRTVYLGAVRQCIAQGYEGEQVLHALSAEGLKCIGLKGWELRKLYPQNGMRQMADLDILIQPYTFPIIKAVMEKLGFSGGSESSWKHDSFRKDKVNIELHKRLTDDSRSIQAWEQGIWDRAEAVDGNIYRMSPEDFEVFHFVHLHKDYLNGKLGLRRIADTWLLSRQGGVNTEAVGEQLEKFGMRTFREKMVKLAEAAMGERPMDEDDEFLLSHAFSTGIYGNGKSYKAGRIAAMGGSVRAGKFRSAFSAVFLPYDRMKAQFPVLEKYPFLLPLYWCKRIVRYLKNDLKKRKALLDYSSIGEEEYSEMKRFFEAGGIKK